MTPRKFFGCKLRLKDTAENIAVQRELFKLGYKWIGNDPDPQYTDKRFLYLDDCLSYSDDEHYFLTSRQKEIFPIDILAGGVDSIKKNGYKLK
jgi:hypothetical protein